MHRLVAIIPLLLWIQTFGLLQNVAAKNLSDQVREFLRNRIEAAGIPPNVSVGEEVIHASVALPRFYEDRVYQPAWSDNDGPRHQADALINAIHEADREGLRPDDYHLSCIEAIVSEIRQHQSQRKSFNPRRLVDLDLLLSDAFLVYASHLLAGRINPETIDAEWHANRRDADLAIVLQTALDTNRIGETLKSLLPSQPGYARLRNALANYREIAANGGWPKIPDGRKVQMGDSGQRIRVLRARLIATGDLEQDSGVNGDLFDDVLENALRKFQERQGLDVDGILGPATLQALNVPVEQRVRQLELNLERWRWLPQNLRNRYILVNMANFELSVVEKDQAVMVMRVIVGKEYRRTPVFSGQMTYLVFNPYWHVPPAIAIKDKLPLIRKDPDYLVKQNMKAFQGWSADAKEIDPQSIDWSKVTAKNFTFRLRQDPGPSNALGRVKFMFPNRFNVYLHDTDSRELFEKTLRTFSSGCIRIEKPIELAEYLLRDDPKWTHETILAAIEKQVEQTVRLPRSIPVHLLYWTAWVDREGSLHFVRDIYGRDKRLDEALREKPPTA
ncbi:MAG: L,D-transpeptidase family protein [Pseudomonadota bacterium]